MEASTWRQWRGTVLCAVRCLHREESQQGRPGAQKGLHLKVRENEQDLMLMGCGQQRGEGSTELRGGVLGCLEAEPEAGFLVKGGGEAVPSGDWAAGIRACSGRG